VRAAGASEVMVASPYHYAIVHTLQDTPEPTLAELLARMSPADITLVEGFRRESIPRIEVHRPALGKPPMYPGDDSILAVVSDQPLQLNRPCLFLDRPQGVADFICQILELDLQPI